MTITIDDALFADLRQVAEKRGEDPNRFAVSVLQKAIQDHQDDADLTDADRVAIREGIRQGLEAEAAGRFRSFAEFADEQRVKHDLMSA